MADKRWDLAARARYQHGLVTRAQAVELGVSRSRWYRLVDRGYLEVVHPGVARVGGAPPSDPQRLLAGVLACGEGSMASHSGGALLWGVELSGWVVEVTVPGRGGRRELAGVVVHRPTDLADLRPQRRVGVPVTNPLRLLVDLGASRPEADVEAVLDQLVVRGVVTVRGARAALERHGRPGRAGAAALRAVLDRWALGEQRPDSGSEAETARWLAGAGMGEPVFHLRVDRYEVDFAWPELRVALEVDGWEVHGRRRAFEADRLRDLHLQSLGWTVLHVSAASVRRRSPAVLARVAHVLASRAAA